tara:strand:- start:117 stop:440 length:324 start_codon:yes stop_codon:yes gene_type:complete
MNQDPKNQTHFRDPTPQEPLQDDGNPAPEIPIHKEGDTLDFLDSLEQTRLEKYLKEATAREDELSPYEQLFVSNHQVMWDELGPSMIRVTQNQWDIWFQIAAKLGVD